MKLSFRIFTLCLLLCTNQFVFSQSNDSLPTVRVDTARRYVWMYDYGEVACTKVKEISREDLLHDTLLYHLVKDHPSFARRNQCFDQTLIFRCHLKNESDKKCEFRVLAGFYLKNARLFKYFPATKELVAIKTEGEEEDQYGSPKISFEPGEDCFLTFISRSAKTNNLLYQPLLVTEEYYPIYINLVRYDKTGGTAIGYVASGVLALMIFFSLISFLQSYRREFLYYCGFAFFIGLLFFFKAYDHHYLTAWAALEEELIDFLLQLAGHICFLFFTVRFLETRTKFPAIHKILVTAIILLSSSFVLFLSGYLFDLSFPALSMIENLTKYAFILLGFYFVVIGLVNYKDKLFRYLLYGNMSMLIMGAISQWMAQFILIQKGEFSFLTQSLFYYELGIVLELGFFLLGLVYKNFKELAEKVREQERLKGDNERKELEKQFAVFTAQQDERNRISADMHDELGAGMTAIRLMSEIAITKTADRPVHEIHKISETANDIVGKLNAIIWSMSTSNDSLTNTISYIKKYAYDYYENTNIKLTVTAPPLIYDKQLSGEKRRNIFLCVKEALNNILKHANATEVKLIFETNAHLVIIIEDNGNGIIEEKLHEFSNGLTNMKRRMEKIGGSFSISNHKGVSIRLTIPLN